MKTSVQDLVTYADGLDASVDGRGFGAEHNAARKRIEIALKSHDDLVAALGLCAQAIDYHIDTRCELSPSHSDWFALQTAKAAIAKAKGE